MDEKIREATAVHMLRVHQALIADLPPDALEVALQKYLQRKVYIGMIHEIKTCSCVMNTLLSDGCQCGGI